MSREIETLTRIARRLQDESRWAGGPLPALWFLTDEARPGDPAAAAAALPPGTGVILRHYRDPARGRLARELAAVASARRLCLFVAADAALARAAGAAGLHLPRWAPAIRPPTDLFVTASAHAAADIAARRGADAYIAGPVFATPSHPGAEPLGILRLAALVRLAPAPVIALGGMNGRTAQRLKGTGAAGIAAIGALQAGVPDGLRT